VRKRQDATQDKHAMWQQGYDAQAKTRRVTASSMLRKPNTSPDSAIMTTQAKFRHRAARTKRQSKAPGACGPADSKFSEKIVSMPVQNSNLISPLQVRDNRLTGDVLTHDPFSLVASFLRLSIGMTAICLRIRARKEPLSSDEEVEIY
jgi:hypothetical protein